MRAVLPRGAVLLLALTVAACGRTVAPDVVVEDKQTRLGESVDFDLEAWRQLPRPELAKLIDEWSETVEKQGEAVRANPETHDLLPRFVPATRTPVFAKAAFSAKHALSVPDYAKDATADAGLARHFARFGDADAAAKFAGDDATLKAKLDGAKYEKNYPAEWTRLVALVVQASEFKLAAGDPDGATALHHVHKQLKETLDAKAAKGALGAALLPLGKRALAESVEKWRGPKFQKTALADGIQESVEAWGDSPAIAAGVPFGAGRDEVAAAFGRPVAGVAITATDDNALARVGDILALPVGLDSAKIVAAFLDDKGNLAEWQVGYPTRFQAIYADGNAQAYRLAEAGGTVSAEVKTPAVQRQSFTLGDTIYEMVRTTRSPAVGGILRVKSDKPVAAAVGPKPIRDVGFVTLDAGFESFRQRFAADQTGSVITFKEKAALEPVGKDVGAAAPCLATVIRSPKADLVESIEMAWAAEETGKALAGSLAGLWAAFGPASFDAAEDGSFVAFTWKRPDTVAQLRLAFNDTPPVYIVRDARPDKDFDARVSAAKARDAAGRAQRLAAEKPDTRLPRAFETFNRDFALDKVALGTDRAAVLAALPSSSAKYRRVEWKQGVSITALTTPAKDATYWARQLLVRFAGDKVAEVRVRYKDGPAVPPKGKTMLDRLTQGQPGQPEKAAAVGLWTDLAKPGKAETSKWFDDVTTRTFTADAGGYEVALTDRPAFGEPKPWYFVGRGTDEAKLGATRDEIEKNLGAPADETNGVSTYRGKTGSPYEMLLVWYAADKASRVVAVHRETVEESAQAAQAALKKFWGKRIDDLGFIRREEGESGKQVAAYYWNDDRVRVKAYVESTAKGPKLLTEWRYWPIETQPATPVAAK